MALQLIYVGFIIVLALLLLIKVIMCYSSSFIFLVYLIVLASLLFFFKTMIDWNSGLPREGCLPWQGIKDRFHSTYTC